MIPHAAALDTALGATAWRPFTRVTFLNPLTGGSYSQVVADGVEGTIVSSSTAWPRTTLEMSVPGGLTPSTTTLPVTAYGGMVVLEVGAYVGNTLYSFQLCELDVDEVTIERPSGTIYVHAVSHEARVNENLEPYPTARIYSDAVTWIQTKVSATLARVPGQPQWPYTSTLTNNPIDLTEMEAQGGTWEVIERILEVCGGEAYFRYDGRLIIRDEPVKGTAVVTIKGGAGGTLLRYRSMRRWAPNTVYVSFEKSDGTFQTGTYGLTTGPASATGAYGVHAMLEKRTVQTLPTVSRANAAAATIGKRAAGPLRRVELDTIPIPWLEVGDTIGVQLLGEAAETHLVTGLRMPLDQLGPMTVITQDSTFAG